MTVVHVLAGCGRMGLALLRGWLRQDGVSPSRFVVLDPAAGARRAASALGVTALASPADIPPDVVVDTLVVAVKPGDFGPVVRACAPLAGKDSLLLSVVAGRTLAGIARELGDASGGVTVVRAMPNLPAATGQGVIVCCSHADPAGGTRARVEALMRPAGDVLWIGDEAQMGAVTAVSGSGPAYLFLLAECLEKAALGAGLPPELAAPLARKTVTGAGALLAASQESPATLRRDVTSPGGTTAAALAVLMDSERGLETLLGKAVMAARRRLEELA